MQKCRKCGKTKDFKEFYLSRKFVCKECLKKILRKYQAKRRATPVYKKKQAEYYRKWYAEHGRNRAENHIEIVMLWRKLNPEKCKATHLVAYALKLGKINKPSCCSSCGDERKLAAHHDDYEFPFKVRWLCYSCHGREHSKLK